MAVTALVAAGDMSRMFALGNVPVVATTAAAQHLGVVNPDDRFPERCTMAVLTHVGRHKVRHRLAGRRHTVVATDTVFSHVVMYEASR